MNLLALVFGIALAGEHVTATPVDGVTLEQIKAASEPINVAKFEHDGTRFGVQCAGSDATLRCNVWNLESNEIVMSSDTLQMCKIGDNAAIMGEENALNGRVVVIPNVAAATNFTTCGG